MNHAKYTEQMAAAVATQIRSDLIDLDVDEKEKLEDALAKLENIEDDIDQVRLVKNNQTLDLSH